jgi:hypothetical protein
MGDISSKWQAILEKRPCGLQDTAIGNEDFDRDFVIKSPSEDKVRELLAEPRIRELTYL